MKKIKNIIVATDFSITARRAYQYACALAKTIGAQLTIVHVKENFTIVSDVVVSSIPSAAHEQLIKDIEEMVTEENTQLDQKTIKGEVKIKILTGNPANVLIGLSERNETDLIVIGTTGFSDVFTKLFGSVSLDVSNKANCPVILVPREARWHAIETILFASNYDSITSKFVSKITEFALNLNAKVHYVNVRNYDPILEPKQKDINWDELIKPENTGLAFERSTIYGNNTVDELRRFSEDNNISLMAFVSKQRNFWQNLAHISITKNMAISTMLPILVMHPDDEEI